MIKSSDTCLFFPRILTEWIRNPLSHSSSYTCYPIRDISMSAITPKHALLLWNPIPSKNIFIAYWIPNPTRHMYRRDSWPKMYTLEEQTKWYTKFLGRRRSQEEFQRENVISLTSIPLITEHVFVSLFCSLFSKSKPQTISTLFLLSKLRTFQMNNI